MFAAAAFGLCVLGFGILNAKRRVRLGWLHPSSHIIGGAAFVLAVGLIALDSDLKSVLATPIIYLIALLFSLTFVTALLDLFGRLPRFFWSREDKENFRMRLENEGGQSGSKDLEGKGDG